MDYPLKIKILQFFIYLLDNASKPEISFSLQEIEMYSNEYKPSISRELRELRRLKICTITCVNARQGIYKLSVYHNNLPAARDRLQKKLDKMITNKKSNVFQTKKLLNDASRSISAMSAKPEIIQS